MTRLRPLLLGASLALVVALGGPPTATAQDPVEDPNLDQVIERDQGLARGSAVLEDGHVDIGPRVEDGALTLRVHDDGAAPPVWRSFDDAVLRVGDAAIQTVPDDPTYSFLGVEPGAEVHVVPQVQRDGVVWVGWNTQDPAVLEQAHRGVTLSLLGVDGPGQLAVYLQSGALGDPEVLWRSTVEGPQPIWVELNTHTHANWVFTEPGTYLVGVRVEAELITGETVSDVQVVRIAVGEDTDVVTARAAAVPAWLTEVEGSGGEPAPVGAAREPVEGDEGGSASVLVLVALAAGALVVVVALVVVRGAATRRRVEAERAGRSSEAGS